MAVKISRQKVKALGYTQFYAPKQNGFQNKPPKVKAFRRNLDWLICESILPWAEIKYEPSGRLQVGRRSSVDVATELWNGRSGDRNPMGGEIFHSRADRPSGSASFLHNEYKDIPWCKVAGPYC